MGLDRHPRPQADDQIGGQAEALSPVRPAQPLLIGVGSINVDLIVGADHAHRLDLSHPAIGLTSTDLGGELAVEAERIDRALAHLRDEVGVAPVICPGGSALNVVAGVAATGAPVATGFVGVRGRDEPVGSDLAGWFGRLGIDDALVDRADGRPGLCLSITRGLERTLLTTGGVNDQLGRWLTERREAIVDRLAAADVVHVTSLAGLDDLEPLVDVVERVAARATGTRLSCDPGAIWTDPSRPPAADRITGRCHQILVNRREHRALGGADAIFDRWTAVDEVVVKQAELIEVHRRDGPGLAVENPSVLTAAEIVDDTGSGDAFAAGYLIGQVLGLDRGDGIGLGLDLARAKLGFAGTTAIDRSASLWAPVRDRFARSLDRH